MMGQFPTHPLFFLIISIISSRFLTEAANSSCPIDFSYVGTFPWDSTVCHEPISKDCCVTLRYLFGIGLSQHLKDTKTFYLSDSNASSSCISSFQANLDFLKIPQIYSQCVNDPSSEYVLSPSNCVGIENIKDWEEKIGTSSDLNSACNGDLTRLTLCSSCLEAGIKVTTKLVSFDPNNSSKCFFFTCLYAAAMVNEYGPHDPRASACILKIQMAKDHNLSNKLRAGGLVKLICAILGAVLGILVSFWWFLIYRKWDKKRRDLAVHEKYVDGVKCRVLPQRKSIILDVAKGLAYLHHGIKPAIYHRDIKATNILLDTEMKAKVADFGLAKQSKEGQSYLTTRVAGTYGYLAPEYALYGQLTEKSDVYSFGIVILEVMSGRIALEDSTSAAPLIADWAWALIQSGNSIDIVDESIRREGPAGVMERFVKVGFLCAHVMVALRPTIADALKMLEGDIDIPPLPDRPLPLANEVFRS